MRRLELLLRCLFDKMSDIFLFWVTSPLVNNQQKWNFFFDGIFYYFISKVRLFSHFNKKSFSTEISLKCLWTFSPADLNSLILDLISCLKMFYWDIWMKDSRFRTRSLQIYIYRHNCIEQTVWSSRFLTQKLSLRTKTVTQSRKARKRTRGPLEHMSSLSPDAQFGFLGGLVQCSTFRSVAGLFAWASLQFSLPYHVWHRIRLRLQRYWNFTINKIQNLQNTLRNTSSVT